MKWSENHSVMSDCLQPHGLYSPWNFPNQNTGEGSLSLLQGIFPIQGSNPRCPTLQVDSLPAESQGKSKNTGVGSLSLLQWIFPTQEFYQGLLHCRQILYQLSSQGSPWTINVMMSWWTLKPHICSYKTILCVCVLVTQLCPTLVTQWTVAHQSSLSMGFSRQEYWSGLLFPSPDNIILAANFKVMLVLFYLVSKNSLCKIKKPMN